MKLFIWPSVKALADAYWGQAYAMAPDLETAIQLLIKGKGVDEQLENELRSTDPEIHAEPFGVCVTGSS